MSTVSKSGTAAALRAAVRAAQSKTASGISEHPGEAHEFLLLPPGDRGRRLERLTELMAVLTGAGVSARTARAVVERLAMHQVAYVAAPRVQDLERFRAAFSTRKIAVHEMKPREIDVKALRERLGYSQSEFARLLGFTLDSVQNWEQPGRPKPQGATLTLLNMAAKDFDATVRLIAESHAAA